ncbi:hypothetical protein D3C86_1826680 [compost metagenome]
MQRADRQCFGTALAGYPREIFQRLGITESAVAGTPQGIQLNAQAPGAGDRAVDRIADAVAAFRGHGQGKGLAVDADMLIPHRDQARQNCLGIEFQIQS